MKPKLQAGRSRVLISNIHPLIDLGRYPVKRIVKEDLEVSVTLVADGHDIIHGGLNIKKPSQKKWNFIPLKATGNDEYKATFTPDQAGYFEYQIEGWIDYASTWLYGLIKKNDDGQDVSTHLADGKEFFEWLGKKKVENAEAYLAALNQKDLDKALGIALNPDTQKAFLNHPQKTFSTVSDTFSLWVDETKARFSSWYEFFPRSAGENGKHGTLKDVERLLPRVKELGFDVLYLPPVHPVGEINRKGKNNATNASDGDVGSPWGIGSKHGGHKSIHPELGTLEDYKQLIQTAKENFEIDIALDLALQCAPDHPYVKENPQWFKWRSDGTVQYAENPPKKYQDILPIYFETEDWKNLWEELLSIITHWIECGVKIFRVDNPHTKSINFWEWAIEETHKKHPEIIFLAEAFTKPALMHQLAKAGFNQSYTYFTWRNFRHELQAYMEELTAGEGAEYFRPNFWPNTPDILPYALQSGNESLYMIRLFLAATLSSNYGVYGPVFEFRVHEAVPGKEEYNNSEKYQLCQWNWEEENKITWLMKKVNRARNENHSLQQTRNYRNLAIENQAIYAYYKWFEGNETMMVCSLDPYQAQEGWVQLPLDLLNLSEKGIQIEDMMTGAQYTWFDEWNYVRLDPAVPFHLFKIL